MKAKGGTAYLVCAFLLLSKAFLPLLLTNGDKTAVAMEDGLWQFQACVALLYILTLPGLLRISARQFMPSAPLWILAAVTAASALWSSNPDVTVRRAVALAGTTAVGMYVGTSFEPAHIRRALAIACWLVIGGSFLLIALRPELGIHIGDYHDGDWRGAFLHKNTLGQFCALAIITFFFEFKRQKWSSLAGCVAAGVLLVGSGSRTAWLLLPILCGLTTLALQWQHRTRRILALCVIAIMALYIGQVDWSAVLERVGRDATLTGRIPLWQLVWSDIAARPWLGYGYGAYWLGHAGDSPRMWRELGWTESPQQAHNGFLDIWLETGVFGLIALVAIVVVCVRRAGQRRDEAPWSYAIAFLVLAFGSIGGELVVQNSVYWLLLAMIVTQRVTDGLTVGPPIRRPLWVPAKGKWAAACES